MTIHASIQVLPCRSVRMRAGLITLSGVSNFVWTDGSFPYVLPKAAVFVRITGERITGSMQLALVDSEGSTVYRIGQEVMPFDVLGISETWFELRWLEFKRPGRYNLRLELEGSFSMHSPILVQ